MLVVGLTGERNARVSHPACLGNVNWTAYTKYDGKMLKPIRPKFSEIRSVSNFLW